MTGTSAQHLPPKAWISRVAPIYRYMDQKFIDLFFQTGALRLSNFTAFRQHKEDALKDGSEGTIMFSTDTDRGKQVISMQVFEKNAYVLCGSREKSKRLKGKYNASGVFCIRNPITFAAEISSYIPGFRVGLSGDCIYSKDPFIRQMGNEEFNALVAELYRTMNEKRPTTIQQELDIVAKQWTDDAYFLKSTDYSEDQEYRLLWIAPDCKPYIDIVCPAARESCEHITDL
jgi:hypothetical protein